MREGTPLKHASGWGFRSILMPVVEKARDALVRWTSRLRTESLSKASGNGVARPRPWSLGRITALSEKWPAEIEASPLGPRLLNE